jgi:hypothetical protein
MWWNRGQFWNLLKEMGIWYFLYSCWLLLLSMHAHRNRGSNRQSAAVGNLVDLPLYHDGGEKRCHECTAKQINRTLQHADE